MYVYNSFFSVSFLWACEWDGAYDFDCPARIRKRVKRDPQTLRTATGLCEYFWIAGISSSTNSRLEIGRTFRRQRCCWLVVASNTLLGAFRCAKPARARGGGAEGGPGGGAGGAAAGGAGASVRGSGAQGEPGARRRGCGAERPRPPGSETVQRVKSISVDST